MHDTDITLGPPTKAQELDDLNRRYAGIKARLIEIGTLNARLGTPIMSAGIMISSRLNLRALIVDANSGMPRGELEFSAGELEVKERWLVNGVLS